MRHAARPVPYADYLRSRRWALLRWLARVRDGGRCRLCDAPARNVHHRTYRTLGTWRELFDLTSLCRRCHARHHGVPE